jgi:hypothetical protein
MVWAEAWRWCILPDLRQSVSLNRAMGQPNLYPIVLSHLAIAKLGFINDTISVAFQQHDLNM